MVDYNPVISYDDTSAVIANGATTSSAIDLQGHTLVGLVMPSAFTGTSITFTASHNGGTYTALYDTSGNALTVTVSTSRTILFSPGDFVGIRFLKLVSGSAEGAARTVTLILRKLA